MRRATLAALTHARSESKICFQALSAFVGRVHASNKEGFDGAKIAISASLSFSLLGTPTASDKWLQAEAVWRLRHRWALPLVTGDRHGGGAVACRLFRPRKPKNGRRSRPQYCGIASWQVIVSGHLE